MALRRGGDFGNFILQVRFSQRRREQLLSGVTACEKWCFSLRCRQRFREHLSLRRGQQIEFNTNDFRRPGLFQNGWEAPRGRPSRPRRPPGLHPEGRQSSKTLPGCSRARHPCLRGLVPGHCIAFLCLQGEEGQRPFIFSEARAIFLPQFASRSAVVEQTARFGWAQQG